MTNRFPRRAIVCALLATSALIASPSLAQEAATGPDPVRQYQDENGVDLLSGAFVAATPKISIGDDQMGLNYVREVRVLNFRDDFMWNVTVSGSTYTVAIGTHSEIFTLSGTTFVPAENNGSTLTSSGGGYTYTAADGTVATFSNVSYMWGNARGNVVTSVTYPNGKVLTYYYVTASYTPPRGGTRVGQRLQAVTSNTGYMIHAQYASEDPSIDNFGSWSRMTQVKALNTSVDSCTPLATSCSETGRPTLNINGGAYTDSEGRTSTYTFSGTAITAIRYPGSSSDDITIAYANGKVSSVTNEGVTTDYSFVDNANVRTVTITHPDSSTRVVTFDLTKNVILSDQNELGNTTSYQYDTNNRPTRITLPEGNYAQLTYDGRGNVTELRGVAKAGSGLADIVSTASFPSTCTNTVTCNEPTSTTDSRGNSTDYTYDSTHGGVLTVTKPAPTTGAVRPQTRYTYTRLGSNGSPSASGIFMLTGASECQTLSSCGGAADELKTSIAYGQGLLPSTISQGDGTGALTATTTATYDLIGNLTYVDGPLSGGADTSRVIYNQDREPVGSIDPDPDGAGSMHNRSVRVTYGPTGLVTKRELGTTTGQTDTAWSAFSPSQTIDVAYDTDRREITRKLSATGTDYALTQRSYDNRGRLQCVAIRMNAASYGSLPSDACTLGTAGSYGPDRITKTIYDATSEVASSQVAFGTSDQANERTLTFTNNGMIQSLTDGENNKTTYIYDGFDRLIQKQYPSTTKGAGSSNTSDYEQSSYDANSNVTSLRLRDGNSIALTYDNLNRITFKDLPGTEPDITYAYDNLDRVTSASQTGNNLSFAYDALSRNVSQSGPQGTVNLAWDAGGRRTRVTYQDGYYVDYDYLVTDDVSKVRENGAVSGLGVLASYAYDDLRRRTSVTFGNATSMTYGYDSVSRLTSLGYDFAGTTYDLTKNFSYNPASQIVSETRSNDLFASTTRSNENTSTTTNGLNEIVSKAGTTFGYDSKGNLTSDGITTYTFDSQNQPKTISGAAPATLTYDPLGRTWEYSAGTGATRYAYEGNHALTQQDQTGTYWRRYVHGSSIIEPLVQYQDQGAVTRRFLATDERGSVIALSDDSGNVVNVNRYDEYGIPQSGNMGGFGYAGQRGSGLANDDNARYYRPGEGVFMQIDPAGPQDDANIYAYVQNDPINLIDPLGLASGPSSGDDKKDDIEVIGHRGPFGAVSALRFVGRRVTDLYRHETDNLRPIIIVGSRRIHDIILQSQRHTAQSYISDKEINLLVGQLKIFSTKFDPKNFDVNVLDPEQVWAEIIIIAAKPPYLTENGSWVVSVNDHVTATYYAPTTSPGKSTAISVTRNGETLKFKW